VGVKIIDKLMYIGLTIMVILSFYLTYLIWLTPASKSSALLNNIEKDESSEVKNYKNTEDIFLPLNLTRFKKEATTQTNSESLIKQGQAMVKENKYDRFTLDSFDSEDEFFEATTVKEGIEMAFADAFPIQSYLALLQKKVSFDSSINEESFAFNRIQIDYKQKIIRFLNPLKLEFFEAEITSNFPEEESIYNDSSDNWHTVSNAISQKEGIEFYSESPLELTVYSYISSTRPYTVFRDAFFTNPKDIRSSDDTEDLKFYDGSESLLIQQEQQRMNFQGIISADQQFDIYKKSYDYIRGLGTNFGSLRLFDRKENVINYRIFVEGFPVFGENSEGVIRVGFSDGGQDYQKNVSIQASLNTIQVPIPSEQKVELPAASTVLENLEKLGIDEKDRPRLLIGYTWRNLEDTEVVDLKPGWYINYKGTWYLYDQLVAELKEEGGSDNGL